MCAELALQVFRQRARRCKWTRSVDGLAELPPDLGTALGTTPLDDLPGELCVGRFVARDDLERRASGRIARAGKRFTRHLRTDALVETAVDERFLGELRERHR